MKAIIALLIILGGFTAAEATTSTGGHCDNFLNLVSGLPIQLTEEERVNLKALVKTKEEAHLRWSLNNLIQDRANSTVEPAPPGADFSYTASLPQLIYENSLTNSFEILRSLIEDLEKVEKLLARRFMGPILGPRSLSELIKKYSVFIGSELNSASLDHMVKVQMTFFQPHHIGAILGNTVQIEAPDMWPQLRRIRAYWKGYFENPLLRKELLKELIDFETTSKNLYRLRCAELILLRKELIRSLEQ